jgi:hypothetical protein
MDVEGPLDTHHSRPFATATAEEGPQSPLLKEFDYVEEEFFVSGTATVYGPESARHTEPDETVWALKPLSTPAQADAPYKTRALVIRPRNRRQFSGVVHCNPFHNLNAQASVERHMLRRGDVWIGVEVCDGTRFGPDEVPSGGVANLRGVDPDRYGDLHITGGRPTDWGLLTPGALGEAFRHLNFSEASPAMDVFVQELFRSYGQGPDIFFDLVEGLRGKASVLPGLDVRRVYTSGASGGSQILAPLIEYHHDRRSLPNGDPLLDGYLIMVGIVPKNRPRGAVLAVLQSEAEAIRQISDGGDPPADTDQPPFRYYEVAGTGHKLSAVPHADRDPSVLAKVLPPGIQGLSAREQSTEFEPYDKVNAPMIWALWDAMYRWVDDGLPMPRSERVSRDPHTPDGVGRDRHGNALGGVRTPWVDVPDAQYVARIARGDPLSAGMKPFNKEKMNALYGSRSNYESLLKQRAEAMVAERWLLAEDVEFMLPTT